MCSNETSSEEVNGFPGDIMIANDINAISILDVEETKNYEANRKDCKPNIDLEKTLGLSKEKFFVESQSICGHRWHLVKIN